MKGHIHHIEIYVKSLCDTIVFWEWLLEKLNYKKYQEWENGISFIFDNTYIVFVQTEERFQYPLYHRCRSGLNHIAFHGGSRDFVDEITQELKKRNVNILYKDKHPFASGYYAVFFEDPNRMKIEITAD